MGGRIYLVRNKIVINSNFNIVGVVPNRKEILTKEWIDYRMELFMEYTLQSFKIQTNQDFIYLIKYEGCTEDIIKNALSRYDKLPNNIHFVKNNEFKHKAMENIDDYDYIYLTRIDCDDMCHKSYVQQLYDFIPKKDTKVLVNQNGYIYNSVENNLLKISYLYPPLYTLIYSKKEMKYRLNKNKYTIPAGHIPFFYLKHELLPNYNYIWHIHSKNTLNPYKRLSDGYGLDINLNNLITDSSQISKILENFIGPVI